MKFLLALLRLFSRLPLRVLYVVSDVCFPVLYYVVRYRRRVVRENIDTALTELSVHERRRVERRFYRWFCDYVVETIKLLTISEEEMRRRITMDGVAEMERELEQRPFVFVYLGHYCNWEWISTLPLWTRQEGTHCAQLYRPLNDKHIDRLFYRMRTRFGAENISKYEAFRHILRLRADDKRTIIGFISDQRPAREATHDWTDFLHHDTPIITGAEHIAKKVDAAVYFADVERVRRGYYHLVFRPMASDARSVPDFQLSEEYMHRLEAMIRRQPHLWLWTHKRWKIKRPESREDVKS